jgi:3-deoxy-manno-octulosonate cytidylyltransferase (CMP-KDO synthetase)
VAATVGSPFAADEDPADPNIVKVVVSAAGRALYFSRSLIPYDRDGTAAAPPLKHVGLYVYRRDFLQTFVSLPPTPLERSERLEQLRILEHGYAMAVVVAEAPYHGIDTPEQYEEFVRRASSGR